jgi:hypothetical protein
LDDYLRAERPDTTEPASFYVPGARSWLEVRQPAADQQPAEEPPLDTADDVTDEIVVPKQLEE